MEKHWNRIFGSLVVFGIAAIVAFLGYCAAFSFINDTGFMIVGMIPATAELYVKLGISIYGILMIISGVGCFISYQISYKERKAKDKEFNNMIKRIVEDRKNEQIK